MRDHTLSERFPRIHEIAYTYSIIFTVDEMNSMRLFLRTNTFKEWISGRKLTINMLQTCPLCYSLLPTMLGWSRAIVLYRQVIEEMVLPKVFRSMMLIWRIEESQRLAHQRRISIWCFTWCRLLG